MKIIRALIFGLPFLFCQGFGVEAQNIDISVQSSDFTFALGGDALITRKLSVYKEPKFLDLIEMIRGADAAFVNLEMLFHDYEPYPMHQSGGTWTRADPVLIDDFVWAGFDMVSRANNHTGDYGVEGMRLTTRYVKEAGLVQAGVGESLAEAREAKFLETAKGRVALISMASTFPDHSRAGRTRGDTKPRPGLSPLRYSTVQTVTSDQFSKLQTVLEDLDLRFTDSQRQLTVFGNTFEVGDERATVTTPDRIDLEEIAAVVSNAKRLADHVIVTIHAHESGGARSEPAEFLPIFARAMIDAGATMFVGHGPHVLRGIEIYRGKPIFYSLGDFVFQNETLDRLPDENYRAYGLSSDNHVADFNDARYNMGTTGFPANREIWEAVVAMPRFRGGELMEVVLQPIDLGFGTEAWERGRPVLAEEDLANKILGDLIERSEPFGTHIEVRDGVGYIRVR
ncbi:MAG TPA: CapA family protein [Gemmatimonadetes bacterium]|jgi:poly-gamma-glutamate synthesis protein (capsule biosynthesis protein)|nr:CapA family protein [Gemmatimonadota bacterium]